MSLVLSPPSPTAYCGTLAPTRPTRHTADQIEDGKHGHVAIGRTDRESGGMGAVPVLRDSALRQSARQQWKMHTGNPVAAIGGSGLADRTAIRHLDSGVSLRSMEDAAPSANTLSILLPEVLTLTPASGLSDSPAITHTDS